MKTNSIKLLIFFVLFLSSSVYSEVVDIVLITTNGKRIIQKVDKGIKDWGLSNNEDQESNIASIENIDELTNLRSFEVQNVSTIRDFSFLEKVKNLRYLHLSCTLYDMKFLEKLDNLEYLCINAWIPDQIFQTMKSEKINLNKLKKIKYIEFNLHRKFGIPLFINVPNKPFLNLNNNEIESVAIGEYTLLEQYSMISMQFNPIVNNSLERNLLNKINILFDQKDKFPDSIIKYTQGHWE